MLPLSSLLIYQEMQEDRKELMHLGLTPDEIEGYMEFYMDTYLEDYITSGVNYASV